jgi:2-polyprenyl-6-hydroxyphenyl methylase/3-demethylubiquinone-9 3-methyltransferase
MEAMQAHEVMRSEATTVDRAEAAKFDALANRWWDPAGPMAPLHAMNPIRVAWILERLGNPRGLRLLDVGCGAGLASEALAQAGAEVLGIDAAPEAIAAARAHAPAGLALTYRATAPENLATEGEKFDAITALEVIEHVADRPAFCAALATLLKPGGKLFVSTINRTPRAFLVAKLGAEYIARLLPRGTHEYRRFVRPAELGAELREAGLDVTGLAGMVFEPLRGRWRIGPDVGINYIACAVRR